MWEGTTQLIAEELWSTADVELDKAGQMFVKILLF